MPKIIKTTFRLKRGKKEEWNEKNPVLQLAEPGFSYDENLLKVGDGVRPWTELDPVNMAVINRKTKAEFPDIGISHIIYKASDEKRLYQWNDTTSSYEPLVAEDNFTIINGGNAHEHN